MHYLDLLLLLYPRLTDKIPYNHSHFCIGYTLDLQITITHTSVMAILQKQVERDHVANYVTTEQQVEIVHQVVED